MPEPNLPPLRLTYDPHATPEPNSNIVNIAHVWKGLKELPDVTRERLMRTFDLRLEMAIVLVVCLTYLNSKCKGHT
jgi:hypothetical protein